MKGKSSETVKVAVRCRPLSKQEIQDQRKVIVEVEPKRGEIIIKNPKGDSSEPPKTFTFDLVYDANALQKNIYDETAYPIVHSVLEGYNGTIFAYGQTGTGKTFTMEGVHHDPNLRGIIPRAFAHVFSHINSTPSQQFLVRASFLELYNEEIRDLLSKNAKNKLELREKPDVGVYVKDLSAFMIQDENEMQEKLEMGRKNRAVGETSMNRDSSRSHSLFTITVEMSDFTADGQNHIRVGKLNLVDLAGSERQSKTQAEGDRLKEAININQSLTTLGNVISALIDPKSTHVPYRDSKLTRLLQDSLGGNTKTVMIANLGPADWNFDETLSTLRYANRAKSIKNKPRINEDPKDAMLREFQSEIMKLREQLALAAGGGGGGSGFNIIQQGDKKIIEKIVKVEDDKKIKEMEEKLAAEKEELARRMDEDRKKIEDQTNLAEAEKARLLKELQEKEESEKKAREAQEGLIKKLKKMEEKLLVGSKAMEQAMKQEKELQRARMELEERKLAEKRIADDMASKEDEYILYEKKYASVTEELEDKKKKLQKIYQKFQQAKSELQDQTNEISREREVYMEQIRDLSRQLKLKNLVIENFIPADEVEKIEQRCEWSDEVDNWLIPNNQLTGNVLRSRPKESGGGKRQRGEKAHVVTEEEALVLQFENQQNVYFVYTDEGPERQEQQVAKEKKPRTRSAQKKPSSAKKRDDSGSKAVEKKEMEENFPKARGLVKKATVK